MCSYNAGALTHEGACFCESSPFAIAGVGRTIAVATGAGVARSVASARLGGWMEAHGLEAHTAYCPYLETYAHTPCDTWYLYGT